jgi:hypothetical protein
MLDMIYRSDEDREAGPVQSAREKILVLVDRPYPTMTRRLPMLVTRPVRSTLEGTNTSEDVPKSQGELRRAHWEPWQSQKRDEETHTRSKQACTETQ